MKKRDTNKPYFRKFFKKPKGGAGNKEHPPDEEITNELHMPFGEALRRIASAANKKKDSS